MLSPRGLQTRRLIFGLEHPDTITDSRAADWIVEFPNAELTRPEVGQSRDMAALVSISCPRFWPYNTHVLCWRRALSLSVSSHRNCGYDGSIELLPSLWTCGRHRGLQEHSGWHPRSPPSSVISAYLRSRQMEREECIQRKRIPSSGFGVSFTVLVLLWIRTRSSRSQGLLGRTALIKILSVLVYRVMAPRLEILVGNTIRDFILSDNNYLIRLTYWPAASSLEQH